MTQQVHNGDLGMGNVETHGPQVRERGHADYMFMISTN